MLSLMIGLVQSLTTSPTLSMRNLQTWKVQPIFSRSGDFLTQFTLRRQRIPTSMPSSATYCFSWKLIQISCKQNSFPPSGQAQAGLGTHPIGVQHRPCSTIFTDAWRFYIRGNQSMFYNDMQFKTENNPHALISLLKNTGQKMARYSPTFLPPLLWYWVVFENRLPARDTVACCACL